MGEGDAGWGKDRRAGGFHSAAHGVALGLGEILAEALSGAAGWRWLGPRATGPDRS